MGAKVKLKWTAEDIGDTGWRAGWYVALVQAYDPLEDQLTVEYCSEPGVTYTVELSSSLFEETIKLVKSYNMINTIIT